MVRVSVAELPAASLAVTVMILSLPQWRGRAVIVQFCIAKGVASMSVVSSRDNGHPPATITDSSRLEPELF